MTIKIANPQPLKLTRTAVKMKPPSIVLPLAYPFAEFVPGVDSAREIVVAGLRWPTPYWCDLAVGWLEQGVPVDDGIVELLIEISRNRNFPQNLRHRAFALYKRSTKSPGMQ
ncbi:hypothetical protein [Burkholderia sp. Ac-20379]|uniref:hypothetical protein n=1 Tax=Burkholderia sp. Ac-20379 TaxID=2703900 RepID=UPI0019817D18|nr:hypothetical protein [Burkholderia sp. Ac-20379]MBN3722604.1 hypothetical protein [Burkholderia sp. Ac-20379]